MDDGLASAAIGEAGTAETIVREVVGVFDTPEGLEAAVDQLGIVGIDRAALSVLGAEGPSPEQPGKAEANVPPWSILKISDDPNTSTAAFVSDISRNEARAAASSVPLAIGGFGAAWAVAAAGGSLVFAIGATVATGALAAGLGALLYHAVSRHHAEAISAQMAGGGLILWVRVEDKATEERALAVLQACGAKFTHTHMIDRPWGVADTPLYGVQPDPFLEHDPSPDVA